MAALSAAPAFAPQRACVRARVAIRGARVAGVRPVASRPAAVRVHASAARGDLQDDLQLGQTAALTLAGALSLGAQQEKNQRKKKGVPLGLGLSAAALAGMPDHAEAATELMQTAGIDARILIFGAFVPVLGWVGYNILKPGLKQLDDMNVKNSKKKGVAAGIGLSAAGLLGMPEQANAATELMQTAGIDARILIFGAFVPVLGWVGYNILKPGLKQLDDMNVKNSKKK